MRVDIFCRIEKPNHIAYLMVPEGRLIPAEAADVEWEVYSRGMELNLDTESLDEYSIVHPAKQIQIKGYAISTAANLAGIDSRL